MNFFKRAVASIIRNLGKTIILFLLVFILGTVIAGAISVAGAISNTETNLRRRMPPIVTIGVDWQALDEHRIEIEWDGPLAAPLLTLEHVREIGALPYIDFYDYTVRDWLMSFEILPYFEFDWIVDDGEPVGIFTVQGNSRPELVYIQQGVIDLVQGREFTENELLPETDHTVAIISETVANLNNLSIGSTFTLYHVVFSVDETGEQLWVYDDENIYERVGLDFEIIGIFDIPMLPEQDYDQDRSRGQLTNTILIPNWALEDFGRRSTAAQVSAWNAIDMDVPDEIYFGGGVGLQERTLAPLFVLENPAYIDKFREVATPLLPSEFHLFEDLSNSFHGIASSMETLQGIATWVLWATIGAALLILTLLITLFLNDRRYEMGVYLAMGEKKGKIIFQILIEVMVISLVGITLAVFSGHFISNAMSRNMLINELAAQEIDDHPWNEGRAWSTLDHIGIPKATMTPDEMIEAFEVPFGAETIMLFYAIGLGTVAISTMASVVYIVKLSPKKVLM